MKKAVLTIMALVLMISVLGAANQAQAWQRQHRSHYYHGYVCPRPLVVVRPPVVYAPPPCGWVQRPVIVGYDRYYDPYRGYWVTVEITELRWFPVY